MKEPRNPASPGMCKALYRYSRKLSAGFLFHRPYVSIDSDIPSPHTTQKTIQNPYQPVVWFRTPVTNQLSQLRYGKYSIARS